MVKSRNGLLLGFALTTVTLSVGSSYFIRKTIEKNSNQNIEKTSSFEQIKQYPETDTLKQYTPK